jgi:hypothetical protein
MLMLANTQYTWHVSKLGNDSNDGRANAYPVDLAGRAKLTISAAVTAAASGDTIIIYPGTYAENVVISKGLTVECPAGRRNTIISVASGSALALSGTGIKVSGLGAITTNTTSGYGVTFSGGKDILVEDCYIENANTFDALDICSGINITVRRCYVKAPATGCSSAPSPSADNVYTIFEDCDFEITGTVDAGAACYTGIKVQGSGSIIKNCRIKMTCAYNGDAENVYGIYIGNPSPANISGGSISITHTGTGKHISAGIYNGASCYSVATGMDIQISSNYGQVYPVYNAGYATLGLMNLYTPYAAEVSYACTAKSVDPTIAFKCNSVPYPATRANDYYNTYVIKWTSGANINVVSYVTDFDTTTDEFTLSEALEESIEVGDTFIICSKLIRHIESASGQVSVCGCNYFPTKTDGLIREYVRATTPAYSLDVASTGEAGLDFSNIRQATSPTTLSNVTIPQVNAINDVALKILKNKAVQNKTTGQIKYYDDDGETVILTHTPEDNDSEITRTPN